MFRSLLLATVAAASFSTAAYAQDVPPPAANDADNQEITVTATRRETSLQSTPVTVSALSSTDLVKLAITRVDQIAATVPNFYVAPGVANSSTVSVSMRGRGDNSGGFGITEQPVSFYFDDVYQARPSAVNSEFTDIERIEVLRGPQGTLFGRNSMTGAVNIISATPGDTVKGNAGISYGNYQTLRLRGAIAAPLVKGALAASIAGVYTDMGKGYIKQIPTGGTIDRRDFWGLRGKLHYYGSEHWDANLTLSHTDSKNDGFVATPINNATLRPFTGDYLTTRSPLDSAGSTEITSASLHVKGEYDAFTVKSITGWSKTEDYWNVDLSGGVLRPNGQYVTGFNRVSDISQEQFSQEYQIFGDALDGKLDWIGGLYFFKEGVSQEIADRTFIPTTAIFTNSRLGYHADTRSIAGYAQLNYKLTPKLEVLVGGRYTDEKKKIRGFVNPATPYSDKTSFNAFTPKFGVNYQAMTNLFLYGSISKGFRSGGYTAGATSPIVAAAPFGPEGLWAYEVGFKSDLFDRKVRFNVAAFINDFKDLVISAFVPGTAVLVQDNGLSERVYGLEAELNIKPVRGLDIFFNGGIQDESKIKTIAGAQLPANLKRNAVVPYYSGMTGFRYELPIHAMGANTFRFGGDFIFRDHMYANINNLPVTRTSSIQELNAEVALVSDAGWQISVAGRNLANRQQWKNGVGLAFINSYARQAVEPRTYRVEFSYRF